MENYANGPEIPMGLGMALAKNAEAMQYFASLDPEQQRQIIEGTHGIQSKQEMQQYVESLTNGGIF
mgnify:CR=1 FL=1